MSDKILEPSYIKSTVDEKRVKHQKKIRKKIVNKMRKYTYRIANINVVKNKQKFNKEGFLKK